jgi:hypothetical protein
VASTVTVPVAAFVGIGERRVHSGLLTFGPSLGSSGAAKRVPFVEAGIDELSDSAERWSNDQQSATRARLVNLIVTANIGSPWPPQMILVRSTL